MPRRNTLSLEHGSSSVDLRPREAAVILAISKGIDTVDALAKALNTGKEAVEQVVEELKSRGLVEEVVEGKIIKRRRLCLTALGLDALVEAQKRINDLVKAYEHYREARTLPPSWPWGLEEFLTALPLLTILGLVPATEVLALLAADAAELLYDEEAYEEAGDEAEDDWGIDEE